MKYGKKEHRARLLPNLDGRSHPSVEFKHANISAVLVNLGLPYIDGYKPRGNYQALLAAAVESYLAQRPDFFDRLAGAPRLEPAQPPTLAAGPLGALFVAAPEKIIVPGQHGRPWLTRTGKKGIDFARRDAENRKLGRLGEEWVLKVEKRRLVDAGRGDLAKKVEWVAETCGDGVGFDVLSFDVEDGAERYLEVKSTGLGKYFPFYVSANEVRCSEDQPEKYRLYRVFDFSRYAKLYVLPGALSLALRLEPVQYRASI